MQQLQRSIQHPSESTWLLIQGTGIKMKECLWATAAFMTEITFPKLLGRCPNTTWYHKLWGNCFWMLAFCQYCTQHSADSCIPEFQRLAFEMGFLKVLIFKCLLWSLKQNYDLTWRTRSFLLEDYLAKRIYLKNQHFQTKAFQNTAYFDKTQILALTRHR